VLAVFFVFDRGVFMSLVLSIDVGSTNLKAGVVDSRGRILSFSSQPLSFLQPEPGAAEHNPEVVFDTLVSTAKKAVRSHAGKVKCLVLSTYNMSFLAVDARLRPLTGIITLADMRSRETFPSLQKSCDFKRLYRNTGCPATFHYPFSKIWWLKKTKPALFKRAYYFLDVKSYLIGRLTGFPQLDTSTASATQMLDIRKLDWDEYAPRVLGINKFRFPPLVEADRFSGVVPASRAKAFGISHDLLLVPGLFDGGATALGLGAWAGKKAGIINMGTTGMFRVVSDRPRWDLESQMRFNSLYLCRKKWFVGGGVNNAGIVIQWMEKMFHAPRETLFKEAGRAQAGSEGLTMLPFLTGERIPALMKKASGLLSGIRPHDQRGHIYRAALESVVYSLKYLKGSVECGSLKSRELRVGGGTTDFELWIKILADVMETPVISSVQSQPALIGGAMLAYTALGIYPNLEKASRAMAKPGKVFRPDPKARAVYRKAYRRFVDLLKIHC
jgi:gluconokinase